MGLTVIALGIDPGTHDGAAAYIDAGPGLPRVVAVAAWVRYTRAKLHRAKVLVWVGGDVLVSEAPDGLGCSAALGALHPLLHVAPDVAAVERMIPHGDTARQSLIVLGEAAGEAVAWCRRRHGVEPLRVTAGEWRRTVGVPARPARLCAHAARALVGDRTSEVRTGVRVAGLPPTLAAIDHVADACLIADHARIVARAGRRDIA